MWTLVSRLAPASRSALPGLELNTTILAGASAVTEPTRVIFRPKRGDVAE
jgi:hypothetical protein